MSNLFFVTLCIIDEMTKKELHITMDKLKIGIIGFGNMGQAMAKGWIRSDKIKPENILASARNVKRLEQNCSKIGTRAYENIKELVADADVIVLAVKPYQIKSLVDPIKQLLKEKIIISVAAGINNLDYQDIVLEGTQYVSTIPNTPVSIGEGVIIVEKTHTLTKDNTVMIENLLSLLGIVEFIETEQLSIAGTLAGCGPAFASMFIEALADGAVKYGLSRDEAYRLASQMMAGTGKLQLQTGEHPAAMKDAVTSPGGTTIKGITKLEQKGFRGAVISAIDAIEG